MFMRELLMYPQPLLRSAEPVEALGVTTSFKRLGRTDVVCHDCEEFNSRFHLAAVQCVSASAADGPISASRHRRDIAAWTSASCRRTRPARAAEPLTRRANLRAKMHSVTGKKGGGASSALLPKGPITSINGAEKTIANFWPYSTTLFDYIGARCVQQPSRSVVMKSTR